MAGPGIGVWVKVKNKSGRMTARVIANKYGGGEYSQGQVITQSEYNEYRQQRAEIRQNESLASQTEKTGSQSPKHKPLMTEAEAQAYVEGSAWADRTFFHGTSGAGADAITTDGIEIERNTTAFYGEGFYMGGTSSNRSGLSTAQGYAGERENGTVLEMKIRVNNPLRVSESEYHKMMREQYELGTVPRPKVDPETMSVNREYMRGVTNYIKRQGYDSLYITDMDFAIAFDPAQVAVYRRFDVNNPPKSSINKAKTEQQRAIARIMEED